MSLYSSDEDESMGADSSAISIFHAFTSVYHLPLYSRLSTSNDTLSIFPTWSWLVLILSPQMEIQTFLGYCDRVSTMMSCLFHSPLVPVPVCSGSTCINFPFSSM